MATATGRTEPVALDGPVPLDDAACDVLRAWADIDGFVLPEVPGIGDGPSVSGEFDPTAPPTPWPPSPPESGRSDLSVPLTRMMFGVRPAAGVERSLEHTFRDDLRFVQTGTGVSGSTYRGTFLLDARGSPVPGSFAYAPLVDFAAGVAHHRRAMPLEQAVATTVDALEVYADQLHAAWEAMAADADQVGVEALVALLEGVCRPGDVVAYHSGGNGVAGVQLASVRRDLLAAAHAPTSPLLARYLQAEPGSRPPDAADVADTEVLTRLIAPTAIARAAWPGTGRPRLSAQVALGAILDPDAQPLVAINAPPGTGASTLVREVYANTVCDRAAAMVAFDQPSEAFGPVQRVQTGGVERRVSAPHPSLTGFELVLASTDEKTVAGAVGELAARHHVGERWRAALAHFQSAAAEYTSEDDARFPRPGLLDDEAPVWGFAAAELDDEHRLRRFAEIVGRSRSADAPGTCLVTELGRRPAPADWERARSGFEAARVAVEQRLARMERWRVDAARIDVLETQVPDLDAAEAQARVRWEQLAITWADADVCATTRDEALRVATERLDAVQRERPGLRALWSDAAVRAEWAHRRAAAAAELAHRQAQDTERRQLARDASAAVREAHRTYRDSAQALAAAENELADLRADLVEMPPEPVDEYWWLRPKAERELGTAWIDDELQGLRQELFLAAMRVHEVFARATYGVAADNLRAWLAIMDDSVDPDSAAQLAPAAWSSLFLVVPLVSTTMPALPGLLRHLPAAALGRVIVDDAGRAAPVAAVGAMARFRRAVVLGDPLQAEPVLTLPQALTDHLMDRHGAPRELGPGRGSVQALADAVSALGTRRGPVWIGLPLRVDERRREPMLTVANRIAYEGALVRGGSPYAAPGPLGPSRWIDVPRPDGRGVHAPDWEHVLELLRCIDWNTRPSVAVISPFRAVSTALAQQVQAHAAELGSAGLATAAQVLDAVSVGTVHSLSGHSRSSVVLVLGGSGPRAREWAATGPNLLTAAVTRATDHLYVIGDHARWATVGNAAVLAGCVPVAATVS